MILLANVNLKETANSVKLNDHVPLVAKKKRLHKKGNRLTCLSKHFNEQLEKGENVPSPISNPNLHIYLRSALLL